MLNAVHKFEGFDQLTGLMNRERFESYLRKELSSTNENLTIMFVDLKRVKFINDAYGFTVGDVVIKKAAERLVYCIGDEGIAARLHGDNFGILLLKEKNIEQIELIANRLVVNFRDPIEVYDDLHLHISISVGINRCAASDNHDVETILKNAHLALSFAKENLNNEFCYYNSFLDKIAKKTIRLELDIQKATENNELFLTYQPKVNLNNNKIAGLEGLLRWNHPFYGIVSPGEFIPIAENTKEIIPIGKWVINEGFKQAKEWDKRGVNFKKLALNVSPLQFYTSNFVDFIKEMLDLYQLDPELIELEITESVMNNISRALDMISQLRALGITVALDDFGTGFSSLNVLNKLPFDCLKIDKSFVRQVLTDKKTGILTKMIVQMGKELDMELVAEGIETNAQLNFMKQCSCNVGQGYYFSKPLSTRNIEAYLRLQS